MMNRRVVNSAAASMLPLVNVPVGSSSSKSSFLALTNAQSQGPANKRAKTESAPAKGRGKGKGNKQDASLDDKYQSNMNYKRARSSPTVSQAWA